MESQGPGPRMCLLMAGVSPGLHVQSPQRMSSRGWRGAGGSVTLPFDGMTLKSVVSGGPGCPPPALQAVHPHSEGAGARW